mmetsp:Transcript_29871/g.70226  ORF Transcript_29871/g.70226 Transcript_29871/m.70226 type:complete len:204 (+) Transcript_29871:273-884(+)
MHIDVQLGIVLGQHELVLGSCEERFGVVRADETLLCPVEIGVVGVHETRDGFETIPQWIAVRRLHVSLQQSDGVVDAVWPFSRGLAFQRLDGDILELEEEDEGETRAIVHRLHPERVCGGVAGQHDVDAEHGGHAVTHGAKLGRNVEEPRDVDEFARCLVDVEGEDLVERLQTGCFETFLLVVGSNANIEARWLRSTPQVGCR